MKFSTSLKLKENSVFLYISPFQLEHLPSYDSLLIRQDISHISSYQSATRTCFESLLRKRRRPIVSKFLFFFLNTIGAPQHIRKEDCTIHVNILQIDNSVILPLRYLDISQDFIDYCCQGLSYSKIKYYIVNWQACGQILNCKCLKLIQVKLTCACVVSSSANIWRVTI